MSNNRQDSDPPGRRSERLRRPKPPEPEAQDESAIEAFGEEGAGIAAKE